MLRKAALFAGGLLVGIIIGVVGTHLLLHRHIRDKWFALTTDGSGFAWMSEALINVDIPLPDVKKPQGKAKFLDRNDIEKGTRLGYLVTTHVAHLDPAKIPSKYKVEKKEGNLTLGLTTEVVYVRPTWSSP